MVTLCCLGNGCKSGPRAWRLSNEYVDETTGDAPRSIPDDRLDFDVFRRDFGSEVDKVERPDLHQTRSLKTISLGGQRRFRSEGDPYTFRNEKDDV